MASDGDHDLHVTDVSNLFPKFKISAIHKKSTSYVSAQNTPGTLSKSFDPRSQKWRNPKANLGEHHHFVPLPAKRRVKVLIPAGPLDIVAHLINSFVVAGQQLGLARFIDQSWQK